MDIMYKVKPILGSEDIVLSTNMYYVKPIGDFETSDLIHSPWGAISSYSGPNDKQPVIKGENTTDVGDGCKENKVLNEKKPSTRTSPVKESKDQKPGKKSKKGKSSGQGSEANHPPSKKLGSSKDTSDGNIEGASEDKKDKDDELVPIVPPVHVPFFGNIIGQVVVEDIAIQVDFDYKPLRVFKVINHLRKNFGLKIAVKVHVSSSVLVEPEVNIDEWKMFETFESTILPRQDNELIVTLIVRRFTEKEAWLNKQPYMILNPHLGTAIYGEVNIVRYITRTASSFCPLCSSIYPENDPSQSKSMKDIDETLSAIQKFLFVRDLNDKQARPQIPEIKDKRLKDDNDLDLKLTLDYILLLSLKL